jgi:hypothetical protein
MDASLGKVNHRVRRDGAGMSVEAIPLPEMPADLRALFEPAKEKVG